MDRIEKLRLEAIENSVCYDEFFYKFYRCWCRSKEDIRELRYSEAFCHALSELTPNISEGELVVGKCALNMSCSEKDEWYSKYQPIAIAERHRAGEGQDSHMAIDYDLVLGLGVNGIIEQIDRYMLTANESKKRFYETCKRCLTAVLILSEKYSEKAAKLAKSTIDQCRREELLQIAEICSKVPAKPAESFYEAVQSVHFITYCLSMNPFRYCHQQFQLGHPDRYLLQYYLKDLESGAITKEYAQLLLDCLGIQINNRVPNGLSSGYMVGGRNRNGDITANDLTFMCMQVVDDIRLVYPAVGLCHTEAMDDAYLEKACEILSHGRSHPAIFNDDIIVKGLKCYGVPEEEAHDYIHSTCVEITPANSSNVWVASPYTNMAQMLLDILDREYQSFDELLGTLFTRLDERIKTNFEDQNAKRRVRSENSMNPLLSCFVNDCLKLGVDIEQGGARYNWIMPSFVGVANLVDSLYAVKTLVFDQKEFTIKELKAVLDSNFEGKEPLRQRILNTIAKYGNNIDDVDRYFGMITEHIIDQCKKYNGMHSNGKLIPSVFCWVKHEHYGRETCATPDGRLAGFPLGDGSGPCQGREMNGPTASILSSTKWAHHEFIGGVAVNMKFSKSALGPNSIDVMKALVKTYLKLGGFEMQINVLDRATLEEAIKNPEEYRDLVVRIGGYSDYFVKLSSEMKKEILLRTEHRI